MADGMTFVFKDREFNSSIDELAAGSRRIDTDVLTSQAIQVVRKLVWHTPLATEKRGKKVHFRSRGRARAGWWPAWKGLGAFSMPHGTSARVISTAEGDFVDHRGKRDKPSVMLINSVSYIDILQQTFHILEQAFSGRFDDMTRVLSNRYRTIMLQKSGRR